MVRRRSHSSTVVRRRCHAVRHSCCAGSVLEFCTCVAMLIERWLHYESWNFNGWARGRKTTTTWTQHRRRVSVPGPHHAPLLRCGAFASWTLAARAGGLSAQSMPLLHRCCLLACRLSSTRLPTALALGMLALVTDDLGVMSPDGRRDLQVRQAFVGRHHARNLSSGLNPWTSGDLVQVGSTDS